MYPPLEAETEHCSAWLTNAGGSGGEGGSGSDSSGLGVIGVEELKAQLVAMVPPEPRQVRGSFLFAVDHCFPIKGQGSVLTGTVLQVGHYSLPTWQLHRGCRCT